MKTYTTLYQDLHNSRVSRKNCSGSCTSFSFINESIAGHSFVLFKHFYIQSALSSMLTKTSQIKHLTEDNDFLEDYFRNSIITQLFIDANLILQKFTPPVMKEFKIQDGDTGKHINEIKDKLRFQMLTGDITEVMISQEVLEKEVITTDGTWYQMNIIPFIVKKTNRANGVIITFVDITKRIRALKDLERVIADHDILLDTISHDIRTPLSTLILAFHLMQQEPLENVTEIQELLQMQAQSVKKMQQLIFELTDTREQEHKYKTEAELLNFECLLEDVRLTLTSNIAQSGAVIKSKLMVPEIRFPQRVLRSILYNLVGNALKYRSPGRKPVVSVTTEHENDFVVLSIKDNGLGIEKSKQDDVFSKYFRVEGTTEGSGIGLHLVKQHVMRTGGKITLQSVPGKGSEFKVYLKEQGFAVSSI